ncbi:uncharacterized protein [Nothobranchius furzeri]|uniref:uncharacterized protein isoform X2 n=1 Tax=Nothobranchius furzeri TaxID=105023 RepID=UPI003904758C
MIRDSDDFDPVTEREAGGFVRMLEEEDFGFLLALCHKIMPHVDMLFNQLQKRNTDSVSITGVIQSFTNSMQKIRFLILIPNFLISKSAPPPVTTERAVETSQAEPSPSDPETRSIPSTSAMDTPTIEQAADIWTTVTVDTVG